MSHLGKEKFITKIELWR